jgi:hypothetical protein
MKKFRAVAKKVKRAMAVRVSVDVRTYDECINFNRLKAYKLRRLEHIAKGSRL